jgi:hypothetical protein
MRRLKFNKIYFPGLISLCFVPLLCIWYFFHIGKFERLTRLTVVWANNGAVNEWNKLLLKPSNINTYRKFIVDSLTGNELHDKVVAADFEAKLADYVTKKDTINGFEVIFTRHAKYGDIVSLIDVCKNRADEKIVFALIDNKIFASFPDNQPVLYKHPRSLLPPL